ncbi:hypothetical protein N7509_012302, partial [Penicillium cosmopolitanum]
PNADDATQLENPASAAFGGIPQVTASSKNTFDGILSNPLSDTRFKVNHATLAFGQTSIETGVPLPTTQQPIYEAVPSLLSSGNLMRKPYRCLEPILMSLEVHVLHPSSVLHPTEPRPTSPALLAVILFSVAQTADISLFDAPGTRERTSMDLYRLSLDLLQSEDPDNYFRTSGGPYAFNLTFLDGWQLHPHPNSIPPSIDRQPSGKTILPRQLGSTDTILAVVILTITISGGHYKADSLKWIDKLFRLVRASGLSLEDQDIDLGPVFCGLYNGDDTFRRWMIAKEERRRLFWFIYCLDRHLALSFNMRLSIPEGTFCVRVPLPEKLWQSLETTDLSIIQTSPIGPPIQISGCGFFEYFLPLAIILGHIIDLHHYRSHPTFGSIVPHDAIRRVESMISQREQELVELERQLGAILPEEMGATPFIGQTSGSSSHGTESHGTPSSGGPSETRFPLVKAYSTYLLHVFYILLHGKWDPILMIEDNDDWITSERFLTCASHALSATEVISQILTLDPEMTFMPYLFGIYLLQGSFILLLFVDRMPELGPNSSVEEVCETIIRAHEVSIVTLDTTFQVRKIPSPYLILEDQSLMFMQKNFRKVFRSMLYDAQQVGPHSWDEHKARRRELLSLYRWTPTAHGLAY